MRYAAGIALALVGLAAPAVAEEDLSAWRAEKCRLYASSWARAIAGEPQGVRRDFVRANEAFISDGCLQGKTCPQTPAELEIANILSLMMIYEGAASTFLPFGCTENP